MKALSRPVFEAVAEPPPPAPREYSAFWPMLLILLVLILSAARDNWYLYVHIKAIRQTNRTLTARLDQTGKKAAFDEKLKAALIQAAPTDPAAAQILQDYFPGTKI
jgi:hypothetical protein